MNESERELIWKYLDGELPLEEQVQLEDWLRASREHRDEFARLALLNEGLRVLLSNLPEPSLESTKRSAMPSESRPVQTGRLAFAGRLASLTALFAALFLSFLLWQSAGDSELQASHVDLQRLNQWANRSESRSFEIRVLADLPQPAKGRRSRENSSTTSSPPEKPPLDGARLHTLGDNQFVLERHALDGTRFLTGSDGLYSWAITPDGAVNTSHDLNRFNRDVPGHEHQLPLNSLFTNLDRFRAAYRIQLFPGEVQDDSATLESTSLLVATKKKGQRGPQRIEVTYNSQSGRIVGMRIMEMPYGPRRLDLEMLLVDEGNLRADFFRHGFHHAPDKPTINEDQPK